MGKRSALSRIVSLGVLSVALVLSGCGIGDILLAQDVDSSPAIEPPVLAEEPDDVRDEVQSSTAPEAELNSASSSTGTGLDALAALQTALNRIYAEVNPSVVSIQVLKRDSQQGMVPLGGQRSGTGSGFIWDMEGHIVTNDHVVEDADEVEVRFYDGFVVDAEIIGTDPNTDLAVLRVDVENNRLKPVSVVDSESIEVGDIAVAIGSPFGFENTMTVGFVSAVGRSLPAGASQYTIPRVIQTDAAINPGNSGGALVNSRGEVIGVTTAIVSPNRSSAGIGFAVPSSLVLRVVPALVEEGEYTHSWLGISGLTLTNDIAEQLDVEGYQQGVLVGQVVPDGPADQAGLQGAQEETEIDGESVEIGGDIIVALEETPIRDFEDLVSELLAYPAGTTVTLTILRDGEEQKVEVTLGERPEESSQLAQAPQQAPPEEAWLGIAGRDLTEDIAERMGLSGNASGVLVEGVAPNGPADQAGLEAGEERALIDGEPVVLGGDVIVQWEGSSIDDFEDLRAKLSETEAGDEVELSVLRDGEIFDVNLTLGER